jgi:hypothetical protein
MVSAGYDTVRYNHLSEFSGIARGIHLIPQGWMADLHRYRQLHGPWRPACAAILHVIMELWEEAGFHRSANVNWTNGLKLS